MRRREEREVIVSVVINAKMPLNSEVNKVKKEMEKQNHFGTNDRVAKDITQHRCILFKFAELIPSLRLNYFHSFMKLCMNFYMNIFSALCFDSKFHNISKFDSGF